MTAVQVPAELVRFAADALESAAASLCSVWQHAATRLSECDNTACRDACSTAIELRALLPQPAPTCPNCGHQDNADHRSMPHGEVIGGIGCYFNPFVDSAECDCPFSREALPAARDLVAAGLGAKPASREPRVWSADDPQPEGVTAVTDREGDRWEANTSGEWGYRYEDGSFAGWTSWSSIARIWAPLTEVLPGGAR